MDTDTHNAKATENTADTNDQSCASSQLHRRQVSSLDDLPEVKTYLTRIGGAAKSMLRAVVEEGGEDEYERQTMGGERSPRGSYKRVVADIVFSRDGDIKVTAKGRKVAKDFEFLATEAEAAAIKAAFDGVEFPTSCSSYGGLPTDLRQVDPKNLFVFRGREKFEVRMIVQRIDMKDGGKVYVPHSYWSDGKWRTMEPDGLLPLYGFEHVRPDCAVMIYEGPKSARAAQKIAEDAKHPWHQPMKYYRHVGWHGGAPNSHRTDWGLLEGVDEVIIVPDHDEPGRAAVPEISRLLPKRARVFSIRWPQYFPPFFDMADAVDAIPKPPEGKRPHNLFASIEPATYATQLAGFKNPEKKAGPLYAVRDVFARQWAFLSLEERFVHRRFPTLRMTAAQFDAHHQKFSDVKQLADLTLKRCDVYASSTYLPGQMSGPTGEGGAAQQFNVYTPTNVRPTYGDVKPWLDFLAHLFPNEVERLHVMDWFATLIARPQNRPGFAMLLYSVMEGVGKGTLVDLITPLIGDHNVSTPSAKDMVESQFNGWIAYKVLVHCAEIYEGHSWKAANSLKSKITDEKIRVNEKFEKPHDIPNCAWFLVNSNDPLCLRIDPTDRKWFIPEVAEIKLEQDEATALRKRAADGGDAAILYWAQNYQELTGRKYLTPGAPPPMTDRKCDMIDASCDTDIQNALEILRWISEDLEKQGKDPNRFTFSIEALRITAQENIPEKARLTASQFSQRLGLHRVMPFKQMKVYEFDRPNAKSVNKRISYIGAKPQNDREAVELMQYPCAYPFF